MQILMWQCCELPYRLCSPSLHGLMNHVKSTHHTTDHFGSVKYAEHVDPMEGNGNSCFVPKIHLTVTQLAEVATVNS